MSKQTSAPRCRYCKAKRAATSDYEQMSLISGVWSRLCWPCADKRLRNPWTGIFNNFRHTPAVRTGQPIAEVPSDA